MNNQAIMVHRDKPQAIRPNNNYLVTINMSIVLSQRKHTNALMTTRQGQLTNSASTMNQSCVYNFNPQQVIPLQVNG